MSTSGKFDFGIIDDVHGKNVAFVGLKPFAKILAAFQPAIIYKNINAIIAANLSEIVVSARAKASARRRSGFLIESIDYQMMGTMIGMAFVTAPYAYFQEKGGTTPTGGRVSGLNYFMPPAFNGMRQYIADIGLFLQSLMNNGTFTTPTPKTIARGSVNRIVSAGKGTHRYTAKIARGDGTFRYVYPSSGQTSRFNKVFKPGIGKSRGGAGARRRVI
jgi:hypothetical protein